MSPNQQIASIQFICPHCSRAVMSGLSLSLQVGPESNHFKVTRILTTIAEHFSTSMDDLLGNGRRRELANPKRVAMYSLHRFATLSYREIADLLHKDISTVIHGIKCYESDLAGKSDVQALIEVLEKS